MVSKNETVWTVFILLGFSSNTWTQSGLFVFFFCIFLINLISNLLIITVSITDISLQTPMYFFLSNLSLMDIFSSSTVVPRLLRDLMSNDKTISFLECAAQMYISLCFGTTECILLSAMAYDRYAAICYPLRYTTMMNQSACIKIASATWIFGFLFPIFFVAHTLNLNICANNTIKHFFCDVPGVLALGCGDKAKGPINLWLPSDGSGTILYLSNVYIHEAQVNHFI
ncbi:olfactory receptor 10A7-like [Bombina bombina]|uniref:olfactory receptor 10A7-like n=1 Tax=Bombina bombina TaxID=8345 RepID=UPI00235A5B7E|nr:olfactory receptor 10A7-like [Bombina bombina]